MIDDPDDQTDYHIAHHIVRVHQKHEDALAPAFTTAELKRYIAYAKTLKPKVSPVCTHFFLPIFLGACSLSFEPPLMEFK